VSLWNPLLDPKAAADHMGVAVNHLADMRARGIGPAWVGWGPSVRYHLASLIAYMKGI